MYISEVCKSYFNGFYEAYHYNRNSYSMNFLALLKILSYFTLIIPISFGTVYGVSSLCGRVCKTHDAKIEDWAKRTFPEVLSAYNPKFLPQSNSKNLAEYSQSEDYKRHAKTARIYYNASQLAEQDALRIIFQREPTNIAMGANQYNKEKLGQLFGYQTSVYIDANARKQDGSSFQDLPNTAAVYSETYLWNPPGGKNKKEVACLSLPAPALDSSKQPHYDYYMHSGKLDEQRYEQEMAFLFKCIESAVRDNHETAFGNKGIKRVVLSKFGQGAFLEALSPPDRAVAQQAYRSQLGQFLKNIGDLDIEVVMSEYQTPGADAIWLNKMIVGDIIQTAQEGDFIVNAWDPHSAPGNGNDADKSFDGAMGKGSGIMLTQTSWLNETLRSKDHLVGIH